MDIVAYLKRIGYDGPLAPAAETLRGLQVAHLLAVPFENLSIHAREPIVLTDDALFEKVVVRRRGGFCYELNGLFAALLRALDFDVTMQFDRAYRIDAADDGSFILMRRDTGSEWGAQYRFTLEPRAYADYAGTCRYHQASPESHFTQGCVCSLATKEGRVTLSQMRLITTRGGERRERELADEKEYVEALEEHFGIVVPELGSANFPERA